MFDKVARLGSQNEDVNSVGMFLSQMCPSADIDTGSSHRRNTIWILDEEEQQETSERSLYWETVTDLMWKVSELEGRLKAEYEVHINALEKQRRGV